MRTLTFGVAVTVYWALASIVLAAPEPWDSLHYPAALAFAVLLAAVAGYLSPHRPARWG